MDKKFISDLNDSLQLSLPAEILLDELKEKLANTINELLQNDFEKLVSILYRMDINEPKLKSLLKENPEADAGLIIADMMIERQEQKIKSRSQFKQRDDNISDEEKW